jgi:hypothetical protein
VSRKVAKRAKKPLRVSFKSLVAGDRFVSPADNLNLLEPLDLPEGRGKRARELLGAALALADDLLATKPAAPLGARGGTATAKRGSEYYRQIAG